ncbi:MAG: tryptophan-rich sensory protein [Candidatus Levybacteria bacterium]|nr:tryptophan-rich sensory protein [Candidatus Levybacteria bacterium]
MSNYLKLFLAILVCQAAGIIGSFFTINSVNTWYTTLEKPFFNPPSWVFGPTWTILYLLMGISLYLVWNSKNTKEKKVGLKYFYIQLVLNALWSIVFFGFKSPPLALIEILTLWIMIFLTIRSFLKINKNAAYLLFPYIAWVSFATILNLFIVILNP